jgi:hypothetical protein
MNVTVNVIAFKLAWLSSILGSANGMPLIGPIVVLAAVIIHLRMVSEPSRELLLILMTGAIGLAWDSVLVAAGWLVYPTGNIVAGLAPYWILGMWMLFATTLNVSFRWLRSKLVLASIIGAVFGPLSYYAGASAGAVELAEPILALTALSAGWSLILPGLLMIGRELDGVRAPARARPGQ